MDQRYNTFYYSHKGLRGMLFHTGIAIQKIDFSSRHETNKFLIKLTEVLELVERHSFHEDQYIFPHLTKYDEHLMLELENDHLHGQRLSETLIKLINDVRIAEDVHIRQKLGMQIFLDFNRFIAFHLQHMEKEEEKVNVLLWENFSNQEIVDMKGAIVGPDHSPKLLTEITWILRSVSVREKSHWLEGMSTRVSEKTLNTFRDLAEKL
ncbi:hypothetical protein [Desertivirga xinjiangensis]|uniref:hypothetical protein n=1 Tax=Desertivirga xinjiangensis TaxID=539206 RepID=UPI00210DF4AB|nr:hypothetical protein [Pedobacter xinjiangensis]